MQKIKYGKDIWIGRSFRLLNPKRLILGERCALGDNITISNHTSIEIGDDFLGASGLCLDSGTHDPETLIPETIPIEIGHRVWTGINVTILAGVKVGDDVVIGAGSLVNKNIPSNSIAVGVPAKVIAPLIRDPNINPWSWISKRNKGKKKTPNP
ncbi:MAG: acyltransferase [Anaerolineales bacterium]|nr:acyltransferase [Anaerolineales bacterium]